MNIIFNWFPPALKKIPSPSMSILKGYLNQFGYKSFVCYWNLILTDIIQKSTGLSGDLEANEFDAIVPFLPILLNNDNNKEKLDRLCMYYQSKFPQYFNINKQYYYLHSLVDYSDQIKERIINVTKHLYSEIRPRLVGVNTSLLQLIGANIFSDISKNNYPEIPIVAGGISNKNEAIVLLENFDSYDFAIWGEGENSLYQLCKALNNEISLEEVPSLAYRNNGHIITNQRNKLYTLLDSVKPDYSDYFNLIKSNDFNNPKTLIPVESSRGCHWNKCKFCFLTEGYKNRAKDNQAIIAEITQAIEKYNTYEFVFLDNDIIFNDTEKFDDLLDKFIEIKEKYEPFGIWNGEVVTKGLKASIIKKMTLAGFRSIQIGYEAICDSLLRKISKKNTFSSNLLFVKWASEYNLNLQGLNIITGLLGEDDQDIITSTKNLHFLRFFLNNKVRHDVVPLQIKRTSRYYKILKDKNELDEWNYNPLYSLFPNNYIKEEQRFDIMFFSDNQRNLLWDNFEKIDNHYSSNDYRYKLYLSKNNLIQYVESLNGSIIAKLEFDINEDYHWSILQFCNKEVRSFEDIIDFFKIEDNLLEQENIKKALEELNDEFLLYSNIGFSENITIINTDFVL